MSDNAAHTHHAIDYIELSVRDVAAAKRFYGAAFGWQFNDYGPGYAGIRGADREIGGSRKRTTSRQAGRWSCSIRGTSTRRSQRCAPRAARS